MDYNHIFEEMRPVKRKSEWRIMAEILAAILLLGFGAVIIGYLIG